MAAALADVAANPDMALSLTQGLTLTLNPAVAMAAALADVAANSDMALSLTQGLTLTLNLAVDGCSPS